MKRINYWPALALIFGLLLAACAKPPVDEMNQAHDAVIRAENDADALNYAPNTLVRARDALTRMESEAEAKQYNAARDYAAEAVSAAEKAIADGKAGAERAKQEAANLVNGVGDLLAETENAFRAARENNIPLDFDGLSRDMDLARQMYEEALAGIEAGNYQDAVTQAESVRSLLAGLNSRLSETAQSVSRKQ